MLIRIIEKLNSYLNIIKFKILFGNRITIGKKVSFRKNINIRIAKTGKLIIGDNCFFNNNCSINCKKNIEIGSDTIFGENVKLYDHDHVYDEKNLIRKSGYKLDNIKIGNNCWICSDVIILRKATIDDNCVIGAKMIVKDHIHSNSIYSNNKIKEIKYK